MPWSVIFSFTEITSSWYLSLFILNKLIKDSPVTAAYIAPLANMQIKLEATAEVIFLVLLNLTIFCSDLLLYFLQ